MDGEEGSKENPFRKACRCTCMHCKGREPAPVNSGITGQREEERSPFCTCVYVKGQEHMKLSA